MRKRLSYANVTATLALVFAMSGGAMAANSYLINSTKQINPKVLKKLTGKPGKNGTAGATGATGATGPTGPAGSPGAAGTKGEKGEKGETGLQGETGLKGETGEPGPLVATLPSGKTLKGAFGGGSNVPTGVSEAIEASISYPFPLAATPTAQVVQAGGSATAQCPGSSGAPSATPGFLCVYVAGGNGVKATEVRTYGDDGSGDYKYGGVVWVDPSCTAPCHGEFWGTWAVTAP